MTAITTAFPNAVHDSQHCFRQLLKAMSEPGQKMLLNRCEGFGSMHSATTQTLLTMADSTTSIWLSPSFSQEGAVLDNLRFYCGSPIEKQLAKSEFCVISATDLTDFDWDNIEFNIGNEEYPDQSTTVIVEMEALDTADETKDETILMTGPGIKSSQSVALFDAPESFLRFLQQRQERFVFPLGVDLILVSQTDIVAIPRTTKVEVTSCM